LGCFPGVLVSTKRTVSNERTVAWRVGARGADAGWFALSPVHFFLSLIVIIIIIIIIIFIIIIQK
jgi:hypothetical protein